MQLYGRGLRRRLPTMLGGDQRRLRMAYSLLFALPGTPTLFYGEEIGMGENLDVDDRLAVRTPMQWTDGTDGRVLDRAARRACAARCRPTRGSRRTPSTSRDQRTDPESLLNWFERLIRLRKELPEIGWGTCTVLDGGVDVGARAALRLGRRARSSPPTTSLGGRRPPRCASRTPATVPRCGTCCQSARPIRPRKGTARIPLRAHDHRWFRLS